MTHGTETPIFLSNGKELFDYEYAQAHMDEEICEKLHSDLAPCDEQTFFDAYVKAHAEKFPGEDFEKSMSS